MALGTEIALIKALGGNGGGGTGGVLVVNLIESETGYTCDKTAAEIMDGVNNGAVIFKSAGEDFTDISYVIGVSYSEADGYTFGVLANGNNTQFYYAAASGTDYPAVTF